MRMRWSGPALFVETPAKINLTLAVLGRRPDGFHELETVMLSVGLYDRLTLTPAVDSLSLRCCGRSEKLAGDESNLVLKAARLLLKQFGVQRPVQLTLDKRIPMEAGLGGGSSDAAAALVGLNEFWKLGLGAAKLHELASTLGSDVNFFLDSTPLALCRGRGEQILAQPFKGPAWLVLAKPDSGLSTAAVFRELSLENCGRRKSEALLAACRSGEIGALGHAVFNDLEVPSRRLSTEIEGVLVALRKTGLHGCRMTGSGSSCFAIARNRNMPSARRGNCGVGGSPTCLWCGPRFKSPRRGVFDGFQRLRRRPTFESG